MVAFLTTINQSWAAFSTVASASGSEDELCLLYESIELETTIRMVVSLSLSILIRIRIWNLDLGLDIRILRVDLVQYIDKGSIFYLDTMLDR